MTGRSALLEAKLRALVRTRWGDAARQATELPAGAVLREDRRGWVLLDQRPVLAFGPALVWAEREGIDDLHVIADTETGVVARRAGCFEAPPTVWRAEGTTLVPAIPDPVPPPRPAPRAPDLDGLLVDADLEVVVEDGIVRGEINGLEVARVVHGTSTSGMPLDAPTLEVGVGQADRELTSMLHGALAPVDQLARVAEIVRGHRRAGADRHPLNQLVPERWLRARCIAEPSRIGLRRLRPVEMVTPRPNLRDRAPAAAVGETSDGDEVVAVFSVGIDLDLVPSAADTRLAVEPGARLLLVVPERDAHPITRALAARLAPPAELVPVPGDWRS